MRGSGTLAASAAVLVLTGAVAAPAFHATGPPPGHTGGFGEPTCQECHTGDPLNAYGGSVRIEGIPDVYVPGETYTLTVILRAEETAIAGFQLATARTGAKDDAEWAGAFTPLDGDVAVTPAPSGRPYVHQTPEGSAVDEPSGALWRFQWKAPPSSGPVSFHVAANSGNGDNSPLGDLVYTAELTTRGAAPPS